ncbi:hypothetical protein FA13DRAFT_132070 [Coprinellus micaceus]|uniref:Uncharacterized protein n=1 Tax=Coprinellus micaceus TaxID=71717 RepID=A0A4Y7SHY5_COPMI|nr:hypothetical protein FA13DRAFT_132070 [Coprinellus micaceus]
MSFCLCSVVKAASTSLSSIGIPDEIGVLSTCRLRPPLLFYMNPSPTCPDSQTFTRKRAPSMFDRQSTSILNTHAGADLRPLRTPKREKGRVTVKNARWNWEGDLATHPYLLAAASSSVVGVDGHDSRPYPMEPKSAVEPRLPYQGELVQPLRRLPTGRNPPPPSQHVDERIFFNEEPPLSPTPCHPTHKRARSRTFTSANPASFADPTNLKSRSETTLGKHRSKLTLHQFQLLVTESLEVEHDVDAEEDYRPRTRRGPPTFHMPTSHSTIERPAPGFSESPIEPIDLVIPPPPRTPAPQPPSPASFYSASSSPHSDPGYDSDSNSTVEAKTEDHVDRGEKDDAGFDSDDALSLPAFYRNPHASHSDETLGTIGSIGSIGTMATVGTMDTMGVALRSLGPAQRPTIRGIRSRVASVNKNGGVVMTERRTSNVGSGTVDGPRSMPQVKAEPTKAQAYPKVGGPREKEKQPEVKTKGILRPKDGRSLETPSSLALSTNLPGLPSSQASPAPNVGAQRPHSSAVAAHKALVGVHGSVPTKVSTPASSTQPPPRPPRRVHRVPPPLILQPPALPTKNLEAQLAITPKSSTSFRFPPPPTPLSPALSFMSSMSALSTVSTIAAVMLNRPKSKQPRISEKELRRRRFLKLTKTLGEDVPPELVSVKAAAPRRSRTISFGAKGWWTDEEKEEG